MTAGTIAPPMMDMTSNAEPSLVYTPRFFTLSAKMVGNMMESKKPSSTTAHTGAAPDPRTAVKVHRKAQTAKNPNSLGGAIRFIIADPRSEEHTSELQSRRDLVCRLLLEKKKK